MAFPRPNVSGAVLESRDVRLGGEGNFYPRNVLFSNSGNFYELGPVIKKTIFGIVAKAMVLKQHGEEFLERTGEIVAIKLYLQSMLGSLQGKCQENPVNEIAAMQYVGTDCPGVITQIECCMDNQYLYCVMKFCEGEELYDFVERNGRIDENRARNIFTQMVSSLKSLQSKGVAHRDLSLENAIFNERDGKCTIIDFGMSIRVKDISTTCTISEKTERCGKVHYMAPELFRCNNPNKVVSPMLCDIWALGVTLLYMLLGYPPLEKAVSEDPRFQCVVEGKLKLLLLQWNARLSDEVVDLIEHILEPDPCNRYTIDDICAHSWMQEKRPELEKKASSRFNLYVDTSSFTEAIIGRIPTPSAKPPAYAPSPKVTFAAAPSSAAGAAARRMPTPKHITKVTTPRCGIRTDDTGALKPTPRSGLPPRHTPRTIAMCVSADAAASTPTAMEMPVDSAALSPLE